MAFRARPRSDRTWWPGRWPPRFRSSHSKGRLAALIKICLVAGVITWLPTLRAGLATPLNAWEHRCVEEEDNSTRVCTTEIAMQYDEHDFLFYFARGPSGPIPFIVQSEGLDFQRMAVTVDDKDTLEADRCEVGVCFFEAQKSHKLIRLFRKGKAAHVLIEAAGSRVLFDAELTLTGFTAAYRRYR